MIGAVVGALVIGLLSIFAVSIGQGIYAGQNTSGWPAILTSITGNITPVIGIVGINKIVPLASNRHRITSRIRGRLSRIYDMLIPSQAEDVSSGACREQGGRILQRMVVCSGTP